MIKGAPESVLLVGEGDFSLTVSLQHYLPSSMVVASSLLSQEEACRLHRNAEKNIATIQSQGGKVLFEVDATKLHLNESLTQDKYARIIFNFPHIGGKSNIKKNRTLLKNFFISACEVLAQEGEVCITLAQGQGGTPADRPVREWHNSWQVVAMAAFANLILQDTEEFHSQGFPLYSSTGFRSQDKHFHTENAVTHTFVRSRNPLPVSLIPLSTVANLNVDGKSYHFNSYIMDKVTRTEEAMYREAHPFSIIRDRIEEAASRILSTEVTLNCSLSKFIKTTNPTAEHFVGHSTDSCQSQTLSHSCVYQSISNKQIYLRNSLLDNVSIPTDEESMKLYIGDIYRPCPISRDHYPVDVEVLLVKSQNKEVALEHNQCFEEQACAFLKAVLGEQHILRQPPDAFTSYLHERWLNLSTVYTGNEDIRIAVSGKSKCSPSVSVLAISMTSLVKTLYGITDVRLLWTKDLSFFQQFLLTEGQFQARPASLYPPTWTFDLSFWETDSLFPEQIFFNICRDFCQDDLVSVTLIDTFHESNSGQKSRCYRLVFSSCDKALSYDQAHDLQKYLRLKVSKELGITLR